MVNKSLFVHLRWMISASGHHYCTARPMKSTLFIQWGVALVEGASVACVLLARNYQQVKLSLLLLCIAYPF